MREPLLSVCVITYNQREYITQCIESILSQKTNFDFNVVIGDDCSTDGTRDILNSYYQKYPEKIKLNLLASKGEGIPGKKNFLSTLAMCSGKFIAFLDGDDYWTNENKLQMQVDYLEKNTDCVLTHHDCTTQIPQAVIKKEFNCRHKTASFYDACQVSFPFFQSIVFRRSAIENLDLNYWIGDMFMGDWPLTCLILTKGNSYYFEQDMAFHRVLKSGLTGRIDNREHIKSRMNFLNKLKSSKLNIDKRFIDNIIKRYYFLNASLLLKTEGFTQGYKEFSKALKMHSPKLTKKVEWISRLRYKNILKDFFIGSLFSILNKKSAA